MRETRDLKRIREAVCNEPWAILEEKLETIMAVLEASVDFSHFDTAIANSRSEKPQVQMVNGVPVIPVNGVISRRMDLFSAISGGTSIEWLDKQLAAALATDAKAILLHFDTPGGNAQGVPEFSRKIYEAAQESDKTIIGLADSLCCSAGYWMGSQCNELYCTEGATVGSIGVICSMVDWTRGIKNQGGDPVIFRSSEMKAAGEGPLSPAQSAGIQGRVMDLAELFYDSVQRGRPNFELRASDPANVFIGEKAVKRGLCDGLSTLEEITKRYGN